MIETARRASEVSVSMYLILAGMEWLYLCSSTDTKVFFQPDVLALRLQERWWSKGAAAVSSSLLRIVGVRTLPMLLVVFGVALLVASITSHVSLPSELAPLICLVLLHSLYTFGLEGADQMAVLVLLTLSASRMSPALERPFELFTTAQLMVSYVTAGVAKLLSAAWRRGEVLPLLLLPRSDHANAAPRGLLRRLLHSHALAVLLTYGVIAYEVSWLCAPVGVHFLYALLALGVVFHLGVASRMGLNLFPWAFVSAYPFAIDAVLTLHGTRH